MIVVIITIIRKLNRRAERVKGPPPAHESAHPGLYLMNARVTVVYAVRVCRPLPPRNDRRANRSVETIPRVVERYFFKTERVYHRTRAPGNRARVTPTRSPRSEMSWKKKRNDREVSWAIEPKVRCVK